MRTIRVALVGRSLSSLPIGWERGRGPISRFNWRFFNFIALDVVGARERSELGQGSGSGSHSGGAARARTNDSFQPRASIKGEVLEWDEERRRAIDE